MSPVGKIHPADALFLQMNVGTADASDGKRYQMSMVNGTTPAVTCLTTRKVFVLGWEDIIKLAIDAGISEETKE